MSDGLGVVQPDPDSDGCLCVVASFVSAAKTIDDVTAEAARRTLMSPALSDFIEFRFTDLGPQPVQGGDRSAAMRHITNALLSSQDIAGRNHFALIVVDRSAAVVARLLDDCAASPFLDKLRMRSLGIANSDDRPSRVPAGEPRSQPRIMTPPTGVWSRKEDLVDVLRGFADELRDSFSGRNEPGLSAGEISEIRERYRVHTTEPAPADSPAGTDVPAVPVADGASDLDERPDVLAGPSQPAQTDESRSSGHSQAEAAAAGEAARDDGAAAGVPEASVPPEALASRARRWIPERLRRRGQQPAADEPEAGADDAAPETEGLAYLLVVGDESCGDDEAALNRSRSALLEVDKKIGELSGFAYQVRMLHGDEDGLRGDLREAGRLGRRDIKRTVASVDFAAVLENVLASLRRDRAPLKAASAAARPAVVFFTPEPPLADTVAAELFRTLTQEATVVWALPKSSKALLSMTFTDAPGVQVIVDDQAVADEIAALLNSGADNAKTSA
jgi:hypothetical protein